MERSHEVAQDGLREGCNVASDALKKKPDKRTRAWNIAKSLRLEFYTHSAVFSMPPTPMCGIVPTHVCANLALEHNLSEEIQAIIAVTQGFLTAMNRKSRVDFEKHCVRAGGMALAPPSPTGLRFCTIGSFIEHVATLKDNIDERIWDLEVKVYETGNLATVWAPFRAKINGVVDHVGVELFVLHKLNGEWKVTGLADSCRLPTEEETNME